VSSSEVQNQLRIGFFDLFSQIGGNSDHVTAICLGMSGVDSEEDMNIVKEWILQILTEHRTTFQTDQPLLEFPPLFVFNDATTALASGTGGRLHGCVVICGTGTIVVGFNESLHDPRVPQPRRASGWGPLLGDEGSGYAIGSDVLKAVCRCVDGREKTLLY